MENIIAPDGVKITYMDTGVGELAGGGALPAIVFLHGIFGSSQEWRKIIRALPEAYRCIAIDMRGHGASEAKDGFDVEHYAGDLETVLAGLGLEDIVLVGFSLGALTIFEYIARYGTRRLKKVVIGDITPKMVSDAEWHFGMYRGEYGEEDFALHLQGDVIDFNREAAYFFYRDFRRPPRRGRPYRTAAPLWCRIAERLIFGKSPELKNLIYELFKSACLLDHRETLARIDVDTACFYADPGSLFTPDTAFYIAEHIPGDTVLVPFHGASHLLMTKPPTRFARELLRFVKRPESDRQRILSSGRSGPR
ncbi:MAG: alpha/beta hydrolase [Clostridiales Family XIII bacterium]|nr:alpha/beta hydrolase [Clostridiales Family XIII bacterium]